MARQNSFPKEEQEITIGRCADEDCWTIYASITSDVQKLRNLAKDYGVPVEEIHEDGIRVKLPLRAVRFRAAPSAAELKRNAMLSEKLKGKKIGS